MPNGAGALGMAFQVGALGRHASALHCELCNDLDGDYCRQGDPNGPPH
jgi:hypothetical protein